MARNRKYTTGGSDLVGLIKWVVLLGLVVVVVGVGYVWQKGQIYQLGHEMKKRELRLAELRNENEKLRQQLATLQSPAVLEARVRALDLGLGPLGPRQEVFVLVEPEPEPIEAKGGPEYAAQQPAVAAVR